MSLNKDQITTALRRLGPSTPEALAGHLGAERSALMYHVKAMLAEKALQQAGNRLTRVLALPDQKIGSDEAAPPQQRQRRKKKGNGAAKKATPRAPRAARPAEPEFIPAFTADDRLVLVHGTQQPQLFSPEQTESIATLLANYFKA